MKTTLLLTALFAVAPLCAAFDDFDKPDPKKEQAYLALADTYKELHLILNEIKDQESADQAAKQVGAIFLGIDKEHNTLRDSYSGIREEYLRSMAEIRELVMDQMVRVFLDHAYFESASLKAAAEAMCAQASLNMIACQHQLHVLLLTIKDKESADQAATKVAPILKEINKNLVLISTLSTKEMEDYPNAKPYVREDFANMERSLAKMNKAQKFRISFEHDYFGSKNLKAKLNNTKEAFFAITDSYDELYDLLIVIKNKEEADAAVPQVAALVKKLSLASKIADKNEGKEPEGYFDALNFSSDQYSNALYKLDEHDYFGSTALREIISQLQDE